MGKFLLVDGDYQAHRIMNTPNEEKGELTLDDTVQMHNFKVELFNSFITLYESLNNGNQTKLIDDLIIVFDNDSWRKSLPIYRPYYIDEFDTTPLGYKDNRKEAKEKSNINYENFKICMRDVENMLREAGCKVISGEGAEGDDSLMMLVEKMYEKNMLLIFCTDGDLKYLVRGNTLLFRNISSKVSKEGEFILSNELYDKLYGKRDMLSLFTQNMSNTASLKDYFDKLFMVKFSSYGKERYERLPDISILPTSKYINLFVKSVCGDKKDNIFATLRWLNGTGSMFNSVTEAMIKKAMGQVFPDTEYSEKTIESMFFTETEENIKSNLEILYKQLLINTKQNTLISVENAIKHYERNLKMNQLELKNLPQYVKDNFDSVIDEVLKLPAFKNLNLRPKTKIDKFKQNSILNILDAPVANSSVDPYWKIQGNN